MKTKWLAMTSLILQISPYSQALAGGHSGNGGGAFICGDPTQSEFFDLYEAAHPGYGSFDGVIPISYSDDAIEAQVSRAFDRLKESPDLYRDIWRTYQEVRQAKMIPVPADLALAWPEDEHVKYIKKSCAAKAIILYHDAEGASDSDSMDLDVGSMNGMPNTQQAAAWVHETVYKFLRKTDIFLFNGNLPIYNSIGSENARRITRLLLSTYSDEQVQEKLHKIAKFNFGSHFGLDSNLLEDGGKRALVFTAAYYNQLVELKVSVSFNKENSDSKCPSIDATEILFPARPAFSMREIGLPPIGEFFNQHRSCALNVSVQDPYGHQVSFVLTGKMGEFGFLGQPPYGLALDSTQSGIPLLWKW